MTRRNVRSDLVFLVETKHSRCVAWLRSKSVRVVPIVATVALSLSGCLGGQTGSESPTKEGNDAPCEQVSTALADDAVSLLGFSVADAARVGSGPRSAAMFWGSLAPELSVAPEQGLSSVAVELIPKANSGVFVQYSLKEYAAKKPGANVAVQCPASELRYRAELVIASAGGALNERRAVVARAQNDKSVSVYFELPSSELEGSLTVTPSAGVSVGSPVLSVELGAEQVRGSLGAVMEQQNGTSVGARIVTYACWPTGLPDCAP